MSYTIVRVPVVDGVATLPNGSQVRSSAQEVRVAVATEDAPLWGPPARHEVTSVSPAYLLCDECGQVVEGDGDSFSHTDPELNPEDER